MTFKQLTQYLNSQALIFLGRELNPLEIQILKGRLMGLTYRKISKEVYREIVSVRHSGSYLWGFCSYALNVSINKKNVREVITRPEVRNKVLEYCQTELGV